MTEENRNFLYKTVRPVLKKKMNEHLPKDKKIYCHTKMVNGIQKLTFNNTPNEFKNFGKQNYLLYHKILECIFCCDNLQEYIHDFYP